MAKIQHLVIDQGTSFTKAITILNPNGSPYDLTEFNSVVATFKRSPYSTTSYSFVAEIDSDPETGIITLSLDPSDTSSISAGRYVYDVLLVGPARSLRALEGILTITPMVSRPAP